MRANRICFRFLNSLENRRVWCFKIGFKIDAGAPEKTLEILERTDNLFIMPTHGHFGFAPAYRAVHFKIHYRFDGKHLTPLLRFQEGQLPEVYDFDRLTPY